MKIVKLYLSKNPCQIESEWYDNQKRTYVNLGYTQQAGIKENQFGKYILLTK